jgi:hypothetical protein
MAPWENVFTIYSAQSRIVNLYGERNSRTDRSMVVNGQYPPNISNSFRFWSVALFGVPMVYLDRWNAIWIDRVTYTREWRRFSVELSEEWRNGLAGVSIASLLPLMERKTINT